MPDTSNLGPWLRRFLVEHLVSERNLARNTQLGYRDTLALLVPFVAERTRKPVERLAVLDLSVDRVLDFLAHLRHDRGCSPQTCNQRLTAIRAFARFVGCRSPQHLEWCGQVRAIPLKKAAPPPVTYLEKPEIDALLAVPNRDTPQGHREQAVLLFLYNSGARVSEATRLTVRDLQLADRPQAHSLATLRGKGGKIRQCPLWPRTSRLLSELVADRAPDAHVFLSRHGRPFTRFGIRALVQRCADIVATRVPSLAAFCSMSCPPPNPTPMHRTTATASSSSPAARYATARLAAPARCSSPEASNPVTIRPRWRTLRDRPRPCRRQSLPHSSSPAGRLAKLHPRTLTQPGRGPKPPSTPRSGPRSNRSRTGLIRATTPLQSPLNSRQPLPAACQSHPMPIAKPSASGSVQYVL